MELVDKSCKRFFSFPLDVETQCDENVVNVTLHFEKEFTGVVHVKGSDCMEAGGAGGRGESTLQVQLLARKCFLRVYKVSPELSSSRESRSETVIYATIVSYRYMYTYAYLYNLVLLDRLSSLHSQGGLSRSPEFAVYSNCYNVILQVT